MNEQSLTEALQSIDFLHDIAAAHLDQLAAVATIRDYDERSVVFREGDAAESIFLVVLGNVLLEICAPGVGCKRILTVGPGEILGWSGLLDEARLTATARTLAVTRLVELDSRQMLPMFERSPQFGYEFTRRALAALARRLSATRMQLLDVYGSELPAAFADEQHDDRKTAPR